MTWKKIPIEISVAELKKQIETAIQNGQPVAETTRCVFTYKDNPCIYMYTTFDFLDEYNKITQIPPEKIFLYQLID